LRALTPAVLLIALACDIPLHAIRATPPKGLDAQALAVGARAPPVGLGARAPPVGHGAHLPAAVVFYRGHW
jgi:hypothetical protein